MKVCLITPSSSFLLDELVFPALGILKVAAVLEQAGIAVRVLDLAGIQDAPAAIAADVQVHGAADVYGVTATMPQMPQAALIARTLRKLTGAKLILGGPHVTLMNASARLELLQQRSGRSTKAMEELAALFDVLVAGDGERAILVALKSYAPKVIDADDPTSTLFLTKQDLTDAPFPARHLIDLDRYHYFIDGRRAQSLILQLGCPFQMHVLRGAQQSVPATRADTNHGGCDRGTQASLRHVRDAGVHVFR